jgi:hypothetical protein
VPTFTGDVTNAVWYDKGPETWDEAFDVLIQQFTQYDHEGARECKPVERPSPRGSLAGPCNAASMQVKDVPDAGEAEQRNEYKIATKRPAGG